MSTPRYVIGTAGHIDHGKTALVKALTGIDTDRLPEEKERGITIELGFAHLALPRSGVVGVVDVPGHERFVRTMVAGAVGIDLTVLVVAADEGVMPQTREHIDICALLGVRRGLVALSKCDLVDDELRDLAALDVREALRGSFLERAPIVPCSARTGAGLDDLRRAIDELLGEVPGKDPEGSLRLPVDRVFSVKGFGTVATGTLWSGRLRVGEELIAVPGGGPPAKVRGLQVHGQPVPEAIAGQRTAVNLALPREALGRGETLVRPGTIKGSLLFDAQLTLLPSTSAPLRRRARVLLHAGTAQRLAQLTLLDRGELCPGEQALAQVQVLEALGLLPGDRFILRGFALQKDHGTTLGGGLVLRVQSPRQRRGSPALLGALGQVREALAMLGTDEPHLSEAAQRLVRLEVARAGVAGLLAPELAGRLPLPPRRLEAALQRLASGQQILSLGGRDSALYASREALGLVQDAVLAAVREHHQREPLQPGLSREALASRLGALGGGRDGVGEGRPQAPAPRLLQRALEALAADGCLLAERDLLRLPGHDPAQAQAARGIGELAERAARLYQEAGLGPPRPEEAAQRLGAAPAELRAATDLLLRQGTLVRVKDLLFDAACVAALRERLVAFLRERFEITPSEWKDLVGQTRKYTIPLAEHFDAERVTLRVGEVRRLRGR